MNRLIFWTLVPTVLGLCLTLASAQERTKDPLADVPETPVRRPASEQSPSGQEQTRNPLSDAVVQAQQKASAGETKDPLTSEVGQRTVTVEGSHLERDLPKNILKDQFDIWTSPARVRTRDAFWLVPFFGVTAGFIATDRTAVSDMPSAPSTVNRFKNISDYGLYGTAAFSGALYLSGLMTTNPHQRETGWLAGEAVLDGLVVNTVIQQVTHRQRPFAATNPGQWFQSSGNAFPSNHAMATWAAAAVIAREYPGLLTDVLAYGTAATVASMRVLGEQHSPSDVVVGSMIGYLIGSHVYAAHHSAELPGESIGTIVKTSEGSAKNKVLASSYVPMDSYVYPLLDNLMAAGEVNSGIVGQRPWTRNECARLVKEAGDGVKSESQQTTLEVLRREFATELQDPNTLPSRTVSIDEFYTRALAISGTPLKDSYFFGQTLYDDYGRPYWKGFNNISGVTGSAVAGRFVMYGRGEYQHAPSVPEYPADVQTFEAENVGGPWPHGGPQTDQFRLIEGYAGVQFSKFSATLGKESLWWGPTVSGPFLFSNNAEPIYMARLSQMTPVRLPWIFGYLGAFKADAFFGKLSGHLYPDQPYVHGEKISFKPTPNLELGFSRTLVFAGNGRPLTFGKFWSGFVSAGDNLSTIPGTAADVGDRRGGFDFSYRVPKLRDWLTIYGDFFTDDDPSPLAAAQRSAIMPGLYLAKVPRLPKLDLRVEAPMTAQTDISSYGGHFFYFNNAFFDGYTNKGFLLGDWIGRQAKGLYVASRYLISPFANVQFSWRNQVSDPEFIPGGGTLNDFRVTAEFPVNQSFRVSGFVQFERWNVPLLAPTAQKDVTTSVQLIYRPNWRWRGN